MTWQRLGMGLDERKSQCMCVCVCVCAGAGCMRTHACRHLCTCACIHAHTYLCMHVFMYPQMPLSVSVSAPVPFPVSASVCVHDRTSSAMQCAAMWPHDALCKRSGCAESNAHLCFSLACTCRGHSIMTPVVITLCSSWSLSS